MNSKVLTPPQEQVLLALFENGLGDRGYYLTGGTALAEFYLQHRYSEDLDLFTRKPEPLREDCENFRELLTSLGFVISSQNITEEYARFLIAAEDQRDSGLKIEFAKDAGAMMAPPEIFGRVVVDSFEDIAVNKICAILNRQPSESKDFCDLFFILRESRYDLDYLVTRAREKEAALEQEDGMLAFATNLLAVDELTLLPRMIKPLSLEELRQHFVPLAEELIKRLRPRGR
jgi:predicted nucleotidyltransferase component of viral defense system